jgi:DNA-binding NarL/FixJ family response regulator
MVAYRSAAAGELRVREVTTRRSAPSPNDPRFEALLLRLHASIDIHEFWRTLLSILAEFLPHDACATRRTAERGDLTERDMAFLQRLHSHLETALQRLSAVQRRGSADAPQPDAAPKHDSIRVLPGELTLAERELVQFVRIGFSNKEIAARLDKSVRTVKTQLTSVYRKCGVRGRSRLLAMMMPRLSYD